MDLELTTPGEFPIFPYEPPYDIQLDLMRHLFSAIESRKVAVVESPTGTVCGEFLEILILPCSLLYRGRPLPCYLGPSVG